MIQFFGLHPIKFEGNNHRDICIYIYVSIYVKISKANLVTHKSEFGEQTNYKSDCNWWRMMKVNQLIKLGTYKYL
jgi:hypothetical protein